MTIAEQELPLFTLGWELEAIRRAARAVPGVAVGHDGSVDGDGLEYRIKRELVYSPEDSLAALRALVFQPGLEIDKSCGFHVHVGLGMKTRKIHAWCAHFVTLARLLEDEVFEAVPESRRTNSYCRKWKEHQGSVIAPTYSAAKHNNETRYCWINPVEVFRPGGIRTVEVRLMGHTKRYTQLLSWISFCRAMAASSWALVHDPSMMELELRRLRGFIAEIKASFIIRTRSPKEVAQTVIVQAKRAGFYQPFGAPLKVVKEKERAIHYQMDAMARERDEYDGEIEKIRKILAREAALASSPFGRPRVGDTVEIIGPPREAGVVVGGRYPVLRVEDETVQIHRPHYGGWWVEEEITRVVSRPGVTAGIVGVTA